MKAKSGKSILLNPDSCQAMFSPKLPDGFSGLSKGNKIDAFWALEPNGMIDHNGADLGVYSEMKFDPVSQSGVIRLTCSSSTRRMQRRLPATGRARANRWVSLWQLYDHSNSGVWFTLPWLSLDSSLLLVVAICFVVVAFYDERLLPFWF